MNKLIKKLIPITVVIITTLLIIPFCDYYKNLTVYATSTITPVEPLEESCGENVVWTSEDNTLIISGTGPMYDPPPHTDWLRYGSKSIKKVRFNDGVTSVCSGFLGGIFSSLTEVYLPESISSIGEGAFPVQVTMVSPKIIILNPDCEIFDSENTIDGCYIIYGYPDSTAQAYAEKYDRSFAVVYDSGSCGANGDNIIWEYSDGMLTVSGEGAMSDYEDSSSIPWLEYADLITSVSISEGVTSICNYAFDGCSVLESIEIPDSVVSIGKWAFNCCSNLKSLKIPDSVTEIFDYAFRGAGLVSIELSNNLNSFRTGLFASCDKLTEIVIPASVKSIASDSFAYCKSLKTVEIPHGVTAIELHTFKGCENLKSIVISDTVSSIADSAFFGCSNLENLIILNPGCEIGDDIIATEDAVVYGYPNSTAEAYATNTGKTFVSLIAHGNQGNLNSDVGVVIVMDISNTMTYNLNDDTTRYDSAISVAEQFIEKFAANTTGKSKIGFVTFNTHSHEIFPMQACTTDNAAALISKMKNDTEAIIKDAGYANSHDRFTNIEAGLKRAHDMLASSGNTNQYIVFLSDGLPSTYMKNGTTYEGYDTYTSSGTKGADGVFYDYVTDCYCSYGTIYSDKAAIRARETATLIKDNGIKIFSIGIDVGDCSIAGYERPDLSLSVLDRTSTTYEIGDGEDTTAFANWLKNSVGSGFYYDATQHSDMEKAFSDIFDEISKTSRRYVIATGSCGENLLWFLDDSGTLNITGSGEMYDFGILDSDALPWTPYYSEISEVVIGENVRNIGDYAFYEVNNINSLSLSSNVQDIGYNALNGCQEIADIQVSSANQFFSVDSAGVLFNKNKTVLIKTPVFSENAIYSIPDSVKEIRENAFGYRTNLQTVMINYGVETIRKNAFSHCTFSEINIPDSVRIIEDTAFSYNTALEDIYIGDGVEVLGDFAFYGCSNLKNINFGSGLKTIGNNAFYNLDSIELLVLKNGVVTISEMAFCSNGNLKSVTIPATVEIIEDSAFKDCNALNNIFFNGTEENFNNIQIGTNNNSLLNANIHFVDDYGSFGELIWYYSDNTLYIEGEGSIPDGLIYDESEGDYLYDELAVPWKDYINDIEKVVIGEGITSVGIGSFFSHFNLREVHLPSTIQLIDKAAFTDCVQLERINLPDGLKSIKGNPFHETGIKKITLPADLTELKGFEDGSTFVFDMCLYLESIIVPESIGAIDAIVTPGDSSIRTIYNRSMDALIEFDEYGFGYWYGDEVTAEFMTISMSSAYDSIINPELTEEELQAIVSDRLIERYGSPENIPEPVLTETVGQYITVYCYENSAQHLYCIENGVNYSLIDGHEHNNDDNDNYCDICGEKVIFEGTFGESGDIAWHLNSITGKLIISGQGPMTDYRVNKYAPWYPYRDQIKSVIIEEGVTSIGDLAFYKCSKIADIQLPDTVERIGKYAFNGCDSLIAFNVPSGVSEIDSKAFHSCNGLAEFVVSEDNGYYTSVDGVLFNKDITELIKFPLAKEVTEYNAPDTLKSIGEDSFNGCMYLTKISFYAETIKENAFYGCENLETVTIGGRVRTIEPYAFYNCRNMKTLTILSINLSIGEWAFYKCNSLETIEYKGSEEMWNEYDFGKDNKPLIKANLIAGIYSIAVEPSNSVITFKSRVAPPPAVEEDCKHNYTSAVIAPTCTEKGFTTYTCSVCGDSYIGDETAVAAHSDENSDGKCDSCAFDLTADCNCSCHSGGLKHIIYSILRIFWKLLKIKNICSCGISHY